MKYVLYLLVFCASFTSFAQQRLLKGVVKDSLHQNLEFANIMADPINPSKDYVFGITDKDGLFEIKLQSKTTYIITISYMGYKPYVFKIDSLSNHLKRKEITMLPNRQTLDEVVIKYQTPVKINNDSIVYNIKHFVNGNERKLKAILNKLPGVQVDRYGQITVMGKKVTSVLVEGKLFFGGDSELAVNNIPADAVKKVTVVKDYSAISFMKGLNDRQKLIINIKLKDGKKRFVFGDVEVGSNTDKNYTAKANLFYYSKKTNLGYIGNLNDIGEASMTFRDILRFKNNELQNDNNHSFNLKNNSLYSFIGGDDFMQKKTLFNALQWQQDVGSKWAFYIYGIASADKIHYKNEQFNKYLTVPSVEETIQQDKRINKTIGLTKLSLSFVPTATQHFDYQISVNKTAQDLFKQTQTRLNNVDKYINKDKENNQLTIDQSFFWHKKISKKHIVRLHANYSFSLLKAGYLWRANQPILPSVIPLHHADAYNIIQDRNKLEKRFHVLLKYYYKINHSNHLYFSLANNLYQADFNNDLWQKESGNEVHFDNFYNDFKLSINDLFAGIQYRFKIAKGYVTPALYAHRLTWYNSQNATTKTSWLYLPEIDLKTKFFYGKLKTNYKISIDIPTTEQFANNYVLNSFNSVQKGNVDLTNELYHSIKLHHEYYSFKHNVNIYSNILCSHKVASVKSEYLIDNTDRYLSYRMLYKPEQSLEFSTSLSKKWKKLYYRLSPSLAFSKNYEILNTQPIVVNNRSFSTRFSVSTRSLKLPDVTLGIYYNIFQTQQTGNTLNYTNIKPFADVVYTYKSWQLSANYKYDYLQGVGEPANGIHDFDIGLEFQNENKPFGFEIIVKNVFNQSAQQRINASSFLYYRQITYQQPLTWMFILHYKL